MKGRIAILLFLIIVSLSDCTLCEDEIVMSPVWITVSSIEEEDHPSGRRIQIHWDSSVRKVAFFTQDPATGARPVEWINSTGTKGGMFETDVMISGMKLPAGWERPDGKINNQAIPGEHCHEAWVASYEGDRIKHMDCLKIRPTWMHDNRLDLGNLDLSSLMIPGTHNSGCFKRGYRSVVSRYILTQDQDIWTQLVHGIRYIDLRVGYYPTHHNRPEELCDSCFWVNHDLIKVRHLQGVLQDIKDFLATAQDEIVILDFHRFPVGFTGRPGRHELLIEFLQRQIGHLALPYLGPKVVLDAIWQQKRRLIVTYNHNLTVQDSDWLWPGIKQFWGNVQTSDELKSFLQCLMTRSEPQQQGIWSAMAHLTPLPFDLVLRPKGGLRPLAHSVGPNLTTWAREWWPKANIIATDFFLENDMISMAIAANLRKGCQQRQYFLV